MCQSGVSGWEGRQVIGGVLIPKGQLTHKDLVRLYPFFCCCFVPFSLFFPPFWSGHVSKILVLGAYDVYYSLSMSIVFLFFFFLSTATLHYLHVPRLGADG